MVKSILRIITASALAAGVVKGVNSIRVNHGSIARICIHEGRINVVKGFFSPAAIRGIQGVANDIEIKSGWIEIKKNSCIVFSKEFPESEHQRLRNVIYNA